MGHQGGRPSSGAAEGAAPASEVTLCGGLSDLEQFLLLTVFFQSFRSRGDSSVVLECYHCLWDLYRAACVWEGGRQTPESSVLTWPWASAVTVIR